MLNWWTNQKWWFVLHSYRFFCCHFDCIAFFFGVRFFYVFIIICIQMSPFAKHNLFTFVANDSHKWIKVNWVYVNANGWHVSALGFFRSYVSPLLRFVPTDRLKKKRHKQRSQIMSSFFCECIHAPSISCFIATTLIMVRVYFFHNTMSIVAVTHI